MRCQLQPKTNTQLTFTSIKTIPPLSLPRPSKPSRSSKRVTSQFTRSQSCQTSWRNLMYFHSQSASSYNVTSDVWTGVATWPSQMRIPKEWSRFWCSSSDSSTRSNLMNLSSAKGSTPSCQSIWQLNMKICRCQPTLKTRSNPLLKKLYPTVQKFTLISSARRLICKDSYSVPSLPPKQKTLVRNCQN